MTRLLSLRSLARAAAFVLLAAALAPRPALAQDDDEGFKNLKVLPAHITDAQLGAVMDGFTDALGVNCTHCHVRRASGPPDFASDEKPEKETARAMIRMVQMINGWHLAGLPTHEHEHAEEGAHDGAHDGAVYEVSCMTCHRGLPRPQTLDRLLAADAAARGVEASFVRYDSLRAVFYGSAAYDFSEPSLIRTARRLAGDGRVDEALAYLDRNMALFPNSSATLQARAEIHLQQGDRAAAVAALERAVALNPNNGRLRRQLEELRDGQ